MWENQITLKKFLDSAGLELVMFKQLFFCPVCSHVHVRVVKGIWVRAAQIWVSHLIHLLSCPLRWEEERHALFPLHKKPKQNTQMSQVDAFFSAGVEKDPKTDVLLSVFSGLRRSSSARMQPLMSTWEKIKGGCYWSAVLGWHSLKKATLFRGLARFCFLWRLPPWSL